MLFRFLWLILVLPFGAAAENWMDVAVQKELAPWEKRGVSTRAVEKTWKSCLSWPEFKRYQVVNGEILGPETTIKGLLRRIQSHYPLPDLDFIYYHQDVLSGRHVKLKDAAPIFVSAKKKSSDQAILFVDWYYDQENWTSLIAYMEEEREKSPWETKKEKLIWRGTPSDGYYDRNNWKKVPRGTLVSLGQGESARFIDTAFTGVHPWQTSDIDWFKRKIGLHPSLPISDHLSYKYQMIIDGITSPFEGMRWRLLSGAVSFRQMGENTMWFDEGLIPWKHYIPVERDLSDLIAKIYWATRHDDEAQIIAQNALDFAYESLMPESILLYCYKLLCRYAELQKNAK